jgi:hypothetical protein
MVDRRTTFGLTSNPICCSARPRPGIVHRLWSCRKSGVMLTDDQGYALLGLLNVARALAALDLPTRLIEFVAGAAH